MFNKGKRKTVFDDDDIPDTLHSAKNECLIEQYYQQSKTKTTMSRLKKTSDLPSCCICMSEERESMTQIGQCKHYFCYECVIEWSKQKNECPVCRQKFSSLILNNGEMMELVFVNKPCEKCKEIQPIQDMIQCKDCGKYYCHLSCVDLNKTKIVCSQCSRWNHSNKNYKLSYSQSTQSSNRMPMNYFIIQDKK